MDMSADPLSLDTLRAADPHAPNPPGKHEWRFLCPLPACAGKTPTAAHRSLTVNTTTGAYYCQRCKAAGKLREHWTERPSRPYMSRRAAARARMLAAFSLDPPPPPNTAAAAEPPPPAAEWKQRIHALRPLAGTPGAAYLAGRGIPADIAHTAGARYAADYMGAPAVVFPIRNLAGALVSAQGRYLDPDALPKTRTAGPMKEGVFQTAGALAADPLVITEAPIDALSLAACGLPAVALCGTTARPWLASAAAFRTVWLAFDADDAGDNAAAAWTEALTLHGAIPHRLRPAAGKDWNELLTTHGPDALRLDIEQARRPQAEEAAPPPPDVTNRETLAARIERKGYAVIDSAIIGERIIIASSAAAVPAEYSALVRYTVEEFTRLHGVGQAAARQMHAVKAELSGEICE